MTAPRSESARNPNGIVGALFFIVCALPNLSLGASATDVQPWAFLAAMCALLLLAVAARGRVRVPRLYLVFALAAALFVVSYATDVFSISVDRELNLASGARLVFAVASLPLISFVTYALGYRVTRRAFLGMYGLWLLVAVIQLFVPSFGIAILARASTSLGRGVVSLATEPDGYGRMVIAFSVLAFFMAIAGEVSRRMLLLILAVAAIQIVFLSRALTSAIIFLVVVFPILWQAFPSVAARTAVAGGFAAFVASAAWVGFVLLPQARIFTLLKVLVTDPQAWTAQGGFVARFFNPFLSLQVGLAETAGLGVGLASTPTPGLRTTLWPFGVEVRLPDRAHGGLVGLVYSAGVLGVVFIAVFYRVLWRALRRVEARTGQPVLLAGVVALTFVFFFDQSVANPMHAYLLGYILLLAKPTAEVA